MPPHFTALSLVLFTLFGLTTLRAQTIGFAIGAWVEGTPCPVAPKFEATIRDRPVPVTAQLGPDSDQIILVVFDLTSDLSLLKAAQQAPAAKGGEEKQEAPKEGKDQK